MFPARNKTMFTPVLSWIFCSAIAGGQWELLRPDVRPLQLKPVAAECAHADQHAQCSADSIISTGGRRFPSAIYRLC